MHIVKSVISGSIAEELEIEPGDELLEINEQKIEDLFDYQYLVEDEYLEILIKKKNGEEWILEVDKEQDEDLGIIFENALMDDYKSCHNKCIFCFIDQMPPGMRDTLYFKDDDSRLSFLQGNYVTLTNMSEHDIDRIIRFNLGPINISVHTTNPELRCKMLNNRFAGDALDNIRKLYEGRIEMNGQVVLCKGINDGEELDRTIGDLYKYYPYMQSMSVVPSGLTKYRDGLYPLELFDKESAGKVIDQIENWQRKIYKETGSHFVQASDEWYIMADRPFPEEERYDGYLQLENGVGMMRLLNDEFMEALEETPGDDRKRCVSIATAVLAYPTLLDISQKIMEKFPNIDIKCYCIKNNFFGESITVSGLITGRDLIEQLKGRELGEMLLLPNNILRSGEDVFLDDITLGELENTLQVSANIVKSSGKDLLEAVISDDAVNKVRNNGNFVYIKAYEQEQMERNKKRNE